VILDESGAPMTAFGGGYLLGIHNPVLVMLLIIIDAVLLQGIQVRMNTHKDQ
jgi:hypothetical protein